MPVRPVRWARWARWDWAPLLVVLALFLLLGLLPAASPRRPSKDYKLVLRNLFLRNCPDTPDAYAKIDEATKIHLLRDGGQLIDVNFTVAKPVRSVRVVSMKINKCRDVVSHDTCEYFTTWSWKTGICNIIVMQNMVWSTLVEGIEPKLKCPIQARVRSQRVDRRLLRHRPGRRHVRLHRGRLAGHQSPRPKFRALTRGYLL
ncbi:uncharacterized protein LOC117654072 isoform X2 [Thrips palmi]|uniref:Uncharacterized protein LOC117654072 isoform X2 n=1 Tax=Thrips palmi TaxID=161013 RepID=A0A6P9AD12_THRPL|nr:uncharacterized protein LOC117654072 isoform X2 [Thrips palmi]